VGGSLQITEPSVYRHGVPNSVPAPQHLYSDCYGLRVYFSLLVQSIVKMLGSEVYRSRRVMCASFFTVDVLNVLVNGEPWADFTPLYVFVMILAVGCAVFKFVLMVRRQRADQI
jgi:hypothetical protein